MGKNSVVQHEPDTIAGYFHLYHGVPTAQCVYISMFVIHPNYQQQRFGQEIIAGLAEELRRLDYEAIRLDIFLKKLAGLALLDQGRLYHNP
ncbi:MAG: GNAT family N-acetyltransferase [Caldilineaceae bacterium]